MATRVSRVNVQSEVREISRGQVMRDLIDQVQKCILIRFYSNCDRKIMKRFKQRSEVHFSKDYCH